MRSIVRLLSLSAAVAMAIGLGLTGAFGATPNGSTAEVIFETGSQSSSLDPGNAVVNGWWGHEGPKHNASTYFSLNGLDSQGVVNLPALHAALQDGGSFDNLRVAFVPASSDGSTERPVVHQGELAGQAFKWWTDLTLGSGIAGLNTPNDSVFFASTQSQWDTFWDQGRPLQGFDNRLVLHDISSGAVSTAPEGTSILNLWPAGTKISVVMYVYDGTNDRLEPKVKVGPDGRAISAWLTLRTVAKPGDPVRTSAGYQVLTASPGEGSKLVNGLPLPQGIHTPGPNSHAPSGHATPGSTTTTHPLGSNQQTTSSGSGHGGSGGSGSGGGSPWTWILGGVAVVGVGALILYRRISKGL